MGITRLKGGKHAASSAVQNRIIIDKDKLNEEFNKLHINMAKLREARSTIFPCVAPVCNHDWEEKLLFTSSYKKCRICGEEE